MSLRSIRCLRALRAVRPAVAPVALAARRLGPAPTPRFSVRALSSTPHGDPGVDPSIKVRDLTDAEYHDLADADMDILHESLEVLCEDFAPGNDWEVEYSSGVMNLTVPPHGTYVINKQPPNHQIWVSSPVSGPARFSLSPDGTWVHHRQAGVELGKLLEGELKALLEQAGASDGWEGTGLK